MERFAHGKATRTIASQKIPEFYVTWEFTTLLSGARLLALPWAGWIYTHIHSVTLPFGGYSNKTQCPTKQSVTLHFCVHRYIVTLLLSTTTEYQQIRVKLEVSKRIIFLHALFQASAANLIRIAFFWASQRNNPQGRSSQHFTFFGISVIFS